MATKFHLEEDGSTTDIVALTLPVFFVRTPEDFLEFVRAQKPDPATGRPDLEKISRFVEAHPESQPAIGFSMFAQPLAGYTCCRFFGIHAFKWIDSRGGERFVRYRWEPAAGELSITEEESRELGRDYLRADLIKRLAEGPQSFRLVLQIGDDTDDPTDPTVAWPEERDLIDAGELVLTDLIDEHGDCEALIWDPTRMIDGIECSEDRILLARPGAYSISYERRTAPNAPEGP